MLDAVRTSHLTTRRSTWATHCLMSAFVGLAGLVLLAVAESRTDERIAAASGTSLVAAPPLGGPQDEVAVDDNRRETADETNPIHRSSSRRSLRPAASWMGLDHATSTL